MQLRCILKSYIYVLEEKHTISGYGGLWKFPSCQMPLERPEGRVCDNKNSRRFRLQGRARSQHSPWLEEFTMLSCAPFQQSSPTFCDPMACSPPSSSARGVLQERIPEWVAIPSSRGPSWFRDWTCIYLLCLQNCRQILYPLNHLGSWDRILCTPNWESGSVGRKKKWWYNQIRGKATLLKPVSKAHQKGLCCGTRRFLLKGKWGGKEHGAVCDDFSPRNKRKEQE